MKIKNNVTLKWYFTMTRTPVYQKLNVSCLDSWTKKDEKLESSMFNCWCGDLVSCMLDFRLLVLNYICIYIWTQYLLVVACIFTASLGLYSSDLGEVHDDLLCVLSLTSTRLTTVTTQILINLQHEELLQSSANKQKV